MQQVSLTKDLKLHVNSEQYIMCLSKGVSSINYKEKKISMQLVSIIIIQVNEKDF